MTRIEVDTQLELWWIGRPTLIQEWLIINIQEITKLFQLPISFHYQTIYVGLCPLGTLTSPAVDGVIYFLIRDRD